MLNPDNPAPLYYQVARDLERQIASKQLRPGDLVPTEQQLCETYSVSRITVRKAMEDLMSKRLIVRQRGVGTFVAESSYANRLVTRVGSVHDAVAYSEALRFRELGRQQVPATEDVAAGLKIDGGTGVIHIAQVGLVGEEPVSFTDVYLPLDVAALLSQGKGSERGPITRLLEQKLGEPLSRVEQTVRPHAVPGHMAKILGVKPRTPALEITRVYYASQVRPVELAVVCYHPHRYSFKLEILQSPTS